MSVLYISLAAVFILGIIYLVAALTESEQKYNTVMIVKFEDGAGEIDIEVEDLRRSIYEGRCYRKNHLIVVSDNIKDNDLLEIKKYEDTERVFITSKTAAYILAEKLLK